MTPQLLRDQGRAFMRHYMGKFDTDEFRNNAKHWAGAGFIPSYQLFKIYNAKDFRDLLINSDMQAVNFEIEHLDGTVECMGVLFGITEEEVSNSVKIMSDHFERLNAIH